MNSSFRIIARDRPISGSALESAAPKRDTNTSTARGGCATGIASYYASSLIGSD